MRHINFPRQPRRRHTATVAAARAGGPQSAERYVMVSAVGDAPCMPCVYVRLLAFCLITSPVECCGACVWLWCGSSLADSSMVMAVVAGCHERYSASRTPAWPFSWCCLRVQESQQTKTRPCVLREQRCVHWVVIVKKNRYIKQPSSSIVSGTTRGNSGHVYD